MDLPTQWTLIEAAAGGDAEQRAALVARYSPFVTSALLSLRSRGLLRQELDDVFQDVFLDAFKTGGWLGRVHRGQRSFRAFLYGVVRTCARRLSSRRGQRVSLAIDAIVESLEATGISRVIREDQRAWARGLAEGVLKSMSEDRDGALRTDIVRMRIYESQEFEQIAVALNLPVRQVRQCYFESLRIFRSRVATKVCATPGFERLDAAKAFHEFLLALEGSS